MSTDPVAGVAVASFQITGMDCAEEIASLRSELGPRPGVKDLQFDLLNAKMTVRYEPKSITESGIISAVSRTGMKAEKWAPPSQRKDDQPWWELHGRTVMTATSGAALTLGFIFQVLGVGVRAALGEEGEHSVPFLAIIFYTASIICGGWFVVPKAMGALRRFRPDMNLLMTVAVIGAVLIGEWFEAATVAFLFALSLLLEAWSVGRARRAVAAPMALSPPKARIRSAENGHEEPVDVEKVSIGTVFIVLPGEKFPLDGKVATGETEVNQAPITGESVAVEKSPGSDVFAGTINGSGAVEVTTTKPSSDTTLAHIIRLVGEAQSRRAPSEQWVERFARIYTPAVMVLALLVALVPPLFLSGSWEYWVYQALVLLVIACPCALVISTPVSIVAALTAAARAGVLVKGGLHMETPAGLRALALDKTGTLTRGEPEVREVVALSGHTEAELVEIAAAIEARSEHPLARAIVRYAERRNVRPAPAESFQALSGKGATALLNGKRVWIGSHRLLHERAQETPEMHARLEELSGAGSSVIVIGNDEHVCGFIAVADQMRPNAKAAVESLRMAGIEHIVMLTGDNRETAEAVAREAGVTEVRSELLPQDKVTAIEELVAKYGQVGMVGDGVNDAPALARASLGIAMGAAGTDAALETADVALMSDDLSRLAWLVGHSRRTLSIIRQNITASLSVKAIFVVLTFAGFASLWAAIAADMGVSLLVVFNALRLLTSFDSTGASSHA